MPKGTRRRPLAGPTSKTDQRETDSMLSEALDSAQVLVLQNARPLTGHGLAQAGGASAAFCNSSLFAPCRKTLSATANDWQKRMHHGGPPSLTGAALEPSCALRANRWHLN